MRVTICSRTGWSRWTSIILCAWILGSCGPASLGSGECSEASCDAAPTPQDSGTAPIDATSMDASVAGPEGGTDPGTDATTPPLDGGINVSDDAGNDAGPPRDVPGFDGCDGNTQSHQVFNAFWREFDTNYAVFDARLHPQGLTWRALGSDVCEQLGSGVPDNELLDLMVGMIRMMNDGHTSIRGRDGWAGYDNDDIVFDLIDLVQSDYLTGNTGRAGGSVRWGMIDRVGYIYIGDMGVGRGAVDRAMQDATDDLSSAVGIIIDVRDNGGGYDSSALSFARWVSGPRTVAWREQERNGPGYEDFTSPREVFVDASPQGAIDVPVVVLVSGWTFSAAETFLLAMDERDDVTFLGERTDGHFSDISDDVRLPNGWRTSYSFEKYTAADGAYYEYIGFPVDIDVPLDREAYRSGRDNMLEAAIQHLTQ